MEYLIAPPFFILLLQTLQDQIDRDGRVVQQTVNHLLAAIRVVYFFNHALIDDIAAIHIQRLAQLVPSCFVN